MAAHGFLQPDDYLSSVLAIDAGDLETQGVRALLLDIDNTLVPRDTHELSAAVRAWVEVQKQHFAVCLLSNNWHKTVFAYAEQLGLPLVYKAMKPFPFSFRKALRLLGVGDLPRKQICVIGDQLLTDVLGARLISARAILVKPQAETDLVHTLILRSFERRLLGNLQVRK
jgi:HAD superfamily phosphatase (TIGR01668 family)